MNDSILTRGYKRRVRLLSFMGAALVMFVALWAADARFGVIDFRKWNVQVRDWWRKDWFPKKDERYAIPPKLPTPVIDSKSSREMPKILPGTDSSISEIPLTLILVSTKRGRSMHEGTAQLGTHAENPQTYSAGALLANGARLLEIYDDHVVLERDGKRAMLYAAGGKSNASNDLLVVGGALTHAAIQPAPTYSDILPEYIQTNPVYDGTALKGYEVHAGRRSEAFFQLGLQNGDVILALNDRAFIDARQALDAFHEITKGVSVSATISRKGGIERAELDGRLIIADQERVKNSPAPTMAIDALR